MIQDSKQFLTNSRKSKILDEIINQFENCEEFIISVAFITFSGVVCILEILRQLRAKGIKGKILTGCYLNFTEPKAFEKLLEFDNIELKVLNDENFHAKSFFFRSKDSWQIILGSSNLTQSALTINNEWNLLFKTTLTDITTQQILAEFDYLFAKAKYPSDILDEYIQIYKRASKLASISIDCISPRIQPNKIQHEALESLQQLRDSGKIKH